METIIIVLKQENCEIIEFDHAYRVNGILEIYRNSLKLQNLITKNILTFKTADERISYALEQISSNPKREAFKQLKNGMAYKEFKHRYPKQEQPIKVNRKYKIPFGKHKGLAIGEVPKSYLKWAMENIPNPPRQFREFCEIELGLN
jgi:uncharacterized protein (DUF3820 family)